ncbi:dTDP-4-dehydrorhamnose reductase [Pseudodesulfovibrio piezophilus C1TLV30]|uniref:dTDP-4-dehydrorhamnose reductase n=1 Tax=Pseudodesulfovibrio piezophilus (strain DSM 21447 / JCM 15486 / C1TLV30) TaxID=1322246 RepID=M1WJ67_PSEP2|nr:dTDP-4-dehydrorhamnose reductase [Pseudodesulfovibrio piezophilus C1TLV30]
MVQGAFLVDLKGKHVIIFGGKNGLLGKAVTKALLVAKALPIPLSSSDCDILNPKGIEKILNKINPDLIINAAAYTNVDRAEDETEAAFSLNATAPLLLAVEAAKRDILLVHYSTDFVFRGDKKRPYGVTDKPGAFSVYGISKAEGERNLLEFGYDKTLLIRISWLFGAGKMNFVEKILSFAQREMQITVVNDQIGSPSYTTDIAENTLALIRHDANGIYHLANSGTTSWFGLASEAVKIAGLNCTIEPVPSHKYPTKAVRPKYSVLDLSDFTQLTGITPRSWQEALKEYMGHEFPELKSS